MGQRGKKTCTGCGNLVGVRTQVCQCGYQFAAKAKVEQPVAAAALVVVKAPEVEKVVYSSRTTVFTPGTGMPGANALPLIPVKPKGLTSECFAEWIQSLQNYGSQHGRQYHFTAFRYMLNQLYSHEPEREQAMNLLDDVLAEFA